jgi:hypothetical protein
MGCAALETSGIAHYNENLVLSLTVFFLRKGAVVGVRIAQKSYFEQKRLGLASHELDMETRLDLSPNGP